MKEKEIGNVSIDSWLVHARWAGKDIEEFLLKPSLTFLETRQWWFSK